MAIGVFVEEELTDEQIKIEYLKCSRSSAYFVNTYCYTEDPQHVGGWAPFKLWPEQAEIIDAAQENSQIIVLKARQLGLSWLFAAFAVWLMIFRASSTVLIFSKRDTESGFFLEHRIKGIYRRLPKWMQAKSIVSDAGHNFELSNGSRAMSFPTTGGDSYTASLVIIDEADIIPDLNRLLRSVKPTVDNGGKIVMISRADKGEPNSEFKRTYIAAKRGENKWLPIFLPWSVHPNRTKEWFEEQKQDIFSRTGSLDDLYEQYPTTDDEALAPRTLDKRIIPAWVQQCFKEIPQIKPEKAIAIPKTEFWSLPQESRKYIVGADPAEGNPNSDDSAAIVLDMLTGEEVAILRGKLEPSTFSYYISLLSEFYNKAAIMIERNNHGHACILWLKDNSKCKVLKGHDKKQGWLSSSVGKNKMYTATAEALRDRTVIIRSRIVYSQLQSIEGTTLRAPEGEMDDCADCFSLAVVGRDKLRMHKVLISTV